MNLSTTFKTTSLFNGAKGMVASSLFLNSGVKNFIEIGPGKALSGMVKRTIKNANCFSINSITDIKNLNDQLKK